MSRIGKKVLKFDPKVKLKLENGLLEVTGPKGTLSLDIEQGIELQIDGDTATLVNVNDNQELNAKHGLYRAMLANMVKGVSVGFEKDLEITGVGYRVQLQGTDLVFALGFSHPVKVSPPEGISFVVEGQTKIKVVGIDSQKVGQVAANLRELRPPDAYKAKGVRYANEVIKRKAGKSVKK